MHTLILVVGGLVALGLFVLVAVLLKRSPAQGARLFILPWLAASLYNLYLGMTRAGIPLSVELPVLAVVFGVPAAVAWFVINRGGAARP
jgi:hypothetical protein